MKKPKTKDSAPTPEEIRRITSALGRQGGLKGGPARAAKMSAAERKKSAQNAVNARWAKYRETQKNQSK
jgi:hypothetical protein